MFWRTQFEAAEVGVIAPLRPSGASPPDSTAYLPHEAQLQEHPSSHLVSKTSSFSESPLLLGAWPPPATQVERNLMKAHPFVLFAGYPSSTVSIPTSTGLITLPCSAREGTVPLTSSRIVFLMLRAFVALK